MLDQRLTLESGSGLVMASLVVLVVACSDRGATGEQSSAGAAGASDASIRDAAGGAASTDAQGDAGAGCVPSAMDAAADADSSGDAAYEPLGRCPADLPGPRMVSVPAPQGCTYCMDSTEVTEGDYAAFLAAKAGGTDTEGQSPECDWNTSYAPLLLLGSGYPVWADWCDADAYCKWAGKRLCGKIGGGAESLSSYVEMESEWYNACSRGGSRQYPYGNTYDPAACNTESNEQLPVPAKATCEGGYPGLFDLNGNAPEWEERCTPDPRLSDGGAESDQCSCRGGHSSTSPYPQSFLTQCIHMSWFHRNWHGGIRCCSASL